MFCGLTVPVEATVEHCTPGHGLLQRCVFLITFIQEGQSCGLGSFTCPRQKDYKILQGQYAIYAIYAGLHSSTRYNFKLQIWKSVVGTRTRSNTMVTPKQKRSHQSS